MERIIGKYEGHEKGPLFICLGAMHGNEPAGVKAIDLVVKMLEVEPIRHPHFRFRGNFVGLIGNLSAYKKNLRYIDKDLNRSLKPERLRQLQTLPQEDWDNEDREFVELDRIVRALIEEYTAKEVIFLDLHTTSSHGGVFTICRDQKEHIDIGAAMHAPIVLGILEGLEGTSMHYFIKENIGVDAIPLSFESGQHIEGLSITRGVAGIINCMKAIGCVEPDVVENHHEDILIRYSENLPRVTRLVERHGVEATDDFKMYPGYLNFQKVKAGEVVAEDKNGPITIKKDGRILMPLYQKQGEDGFFLVQELP